MTSILISKLSDYASNLGVNVPNDQLVTIVMGINRTIEEELQEGEFGELSEQTGFVVSEFAEIVSEIKYPNDENKSQDCYEEIHGNSDGKLDEIMQYIETNWNNIYRENYKL